MKAKSCPRCWRVQCICRTFDGMGEAVEAQSQAAAELQGEELTAKLREPLASIDTKAARMEEESPLFFGKVNPTLF